MANGDYRMGAMALPGRSGRRGGAGFRWIAAGVVITLLVLLIDASIHSRSPGPVQSLAAATWVDRALPAITSSNEEGQVLASLWSGGLKMPPAAMAAEVDQVAAGAAQQYATLTALRPPADLGGPAGLLEAALLARSKAATELQRAFGAVLGAGAVAPGTRSVSSVPAAVDPASVIPEVTAAGSEIQVGDQAYQLFVSSVPASLGVKLPPSVWGANAAPYAPQAAQVFLASLQSKTVTTPVYQVKVYGVALDPPAVSTAGPVQILPDATAVTLTIVLADTGNQPAPNLTVTATITPAGHGSSSVRDFVNLAVGQAYTIVGLGPLNPPQGTPVTLTVTVTAATGSTIPPVSQSLVFQMPAPPAPTTTTTLGPTSSTVGSTPPTT
jgi:hypothetical protein